jgi:hypothetical protein
LKHRQNPRRLNLLKPKWKPRHPRLDVFHFR